MAPPSAAVSQKQGTTVDFDLGWVIREAIKGLPPSLGESELPWPDEAANLKTLIEEVSGMPKQPETQLNHRSAATAVRMIQNHPGSQNASLIQANSIRSPPYHPVNPGALVRGNDQRSWTMTQQARTVLPPQMMPQPQAVVPPRRHRNLQYIPGSNLPPRADHGSQFVPIVSAEAHPWSPMPPSTPQYHPIPQGFPARQTYSRPSAHHRSPNGPPLGSYDSFQRSQDGQNSGHQLTNGLRHNSSNQRNVGPQQVYGFQPSSGPQESNTRVYNSYGFQQSTGPHSNGGFPQNRGVQQNNGFQLDQGAQQSQPHEDQQGNSSQSENVSHQDDASHQENVPRRGEGQ